MQSISGLLTQSDESLMARVRERDDSHAFTRLVRRWEHPIQRLCARMTGDLHRAEDLAQETFARLFAHRKDYRGTSRFSTFLWRIALNLCYDERRRMSRRNESSLDDEEGDGFAVAETLVSEEPPPDAVAMAQEQTERVQAALMRLPETYRSVVVLRHFEELKFREIAAVLDIPEGTVKSRMAEGLSQLAKILKPAPDEKEVRSQKPEARMEPRL